MTKGKLTERQREWEVVSMSFFLITALFSMVAYYQVFPPTVVEEIDVFYSDVGYNGLYTETIVLTNGTGKRIFIGNYTFDPNSTYRVKWENSGVRYGIRVKLRSVEKIN